MQKIFVLWVTSHGLAKTNQLNGSFLSDAPFWSWYWMLHFGSKKNEVSRAATFRLSSARVARQFRSLVPSPPWCLLSASRIVSHLSFLLSEKRASRCFRVNGVPAPERWTQWANWCHVCAVDRGVVCNFRSAVVSAALYCSMRPVSFVRWPMGTSCVSFVAGVFFF